MDSHAAGPKKLVRANRGSVLLESVLTKFTVTLSIVLVHLKDHRVRGRLHAPLFYRYD